MLQRKHLKQNNTFRKTIQTKIHELFFSLECVQYCYSSLAGCENMVYYLFKTFYEALTHLNINRLMCEGWNLKLKTEQDCLCSPSIHACLCSGMKQK